MSPAGDDWLDRLRASDVNRYCGYVLGPVLGVGEQPWPLGWESEPGCGVHGWELVTVRYPWLDRGGGDRHVENVVRCHTCHHPRCGHSQDTDPCQLVRHHLGEHGQYLPDRRAL